MIDRFEVSVVKHHVFVNGKPTEDISSNRFRLVSKIGNGLIVKADYLKDDDSLHIQTKSEREMYSCIHARDLPYFPELIGSGFYRGTSNHMFNWIVERAAKLIGGARVSPKMNRIVTRLAGKYGIYDLAVLNVGDLIDDPDANWGVTKFGVPIIFDFGSNKYSTGEWSC